MEFVRREFLGLVGTALAKPVLSQSAALTILIIRHAEKPDEFWPGPGLTSDGSVDKKSLVIRGWQRAGSWSALFGVGLGGDDFPGPNVIYAANPDTPGGAEPSQRPFETITPLAARLESDAICHIRRWAGTTARRRDRQPYRRCVGLLGAQGDRQCDPAGNRWRSTPAGNAEEMGWRALRCRAPVRPERARRPLVLPSAFSASSIGRFRHTAEMKWALPLVLAI